MNIIVSDAARDHLLAVLAHTPRAHAVRVSVERQGCAGFGWRLVPIEAPLPNELTHRVGELTLVCAPEHAALLDGLRLDTQRKGLGYVLDIRSQAETERCACGQSFAV